MTKADLRYLKNIGTIGIAIPYRAIGGGGGSSGWATKHYDQDHKNWGNILRREVLHQIIVLELAMRGNPASCYVGTPRHVWEVWGVNNDAKQSHGNKFPAG